MAAKQTFTVGQVLTAAEMTALQAAAYQESTYTAKTAAYTFAAGDEGQLFSMNNAGSVQFNIPVDATYNFAIGTEFNVFWNWANPLDTKKHNNE